MPSTIPDVKVVLAKEGRFCTMGLYRKVQQGVGKFRTQKSLKFRVASTGMFFLAMVLTVGGMRSLFAGSFGSSSFIFNLQPFADPSGFVATYNASGNINTGNDFFQSLGTNGRSCGTCHVLANAMGLSAAHAQAQFAKNGGTDPLFANVDGANCPTDTPDQAGSHSLLLNNGLIRIGLTLPANIGIGHSVPAGDQFSISVVHDPYGCAMTTDASTGQTTVSVYRRPLPATNLNFLSAVMFDGRETVAPLNNSLTFAANLVTDLTHQALDATLEHAQASTPPTSAQLSQIVNFELGLHSAQIWDNAAYLLVADRARGGPLALSQQNYYPGINDVLGGDPTGAQFTNDVFTIYQPWLNLQAFAGSFGGSEETAEARQAIANGEKIFDTFPLTITAVRGLNDNPAVAGSGGLPVATIAGTCSTCHDAPNVGDHSLPLPLDIGTSHAAAEETNPQIANGLAELSVSDLPVFEIDGCSDPFNPGSIVPIYTSDPGKALLTGQCSDLNRIKGPILRGLAARAPYFHNGAAATLDQVVDFYNQRFQMNLSDEQKRDLIAFLKSL
jgi:cytochrome c peroxidase